MFYLFVNSFVKKRVVKKGVIYPGIRNFLFSIHRGMLPYIH
jgi:hypothetical protein